MRTERREVGFFRNAVPAALCAKWVNPAAHLGANQTHVYREKSGNQFGVDLAKREAKIVSSAHQSEINDWVGRLITQAIATFHGFRVRDWEQPQLLRYERDGKHEIHADSEVHEDGVWRRVLDRDYSLVVFLNTDFVGGAFDLPNQDLQIHPAEPGSAISFPSDHEFSHAVMPIENGTRYTLVSWIRCLRS